MKKETLVNVLQKDTSGGGLMVIELHNYLLRKNHIKHDVKIGDMWDIKDFVVNYSEPMKMFWAAAKGNINKDDNYYYLKDDVMNSTNDLLDPDLNILYWELDLFLDKILEEWNVCENIIEEFID